MAHIKGKKYGMIWVDIEILKWSSNHESNREFISAMVNELVKLGINVGIYTNKHNWESICGVDWNGVSKHALWYAHYDNNPSFSDFS